MVIDTLLWRRLDSPGHDGCRLRRLADGWELEGTAAFRHEGVVAGLHYAVTCDSGWRTLEGLVCGWLGARTVEFRITRAPDDVWRLNGQVLDRLQGLLDLDLGFTPATNLLHLRRAALPIGQTADIPVAWLDLSAGTLDLLEQRYVRRSPEEYWYEAPRFEYFNSLRVNTTGFVLHYPHLWIAVP